MRNFSIKEAVREAVPLNIGIAGPSGGGKTGSALELAHGIQEVCGGDIGGLDTEAKRMLAYAGMSMFSNPAKKFKFKHLAFGAPFGPLDYVVALESLIKAGCKTIIVDSTSHEHSGTGGVLEMHEAQLDKMAGSDYDKRNKVQMLAWAKPKAERQVLINFFLQQSVNFIFCFRAKEKIKLVTGKPPVNMGWQPIAGEEFVYEMSLCCLLLPSANGVPQWAPEEIGEKMMVKLPQQFKKICTPGKPLSAAMGKELATWAAGGVTTAPPDAPSASPAPQQATKQAAGAVSTPQSDPMPFLAVNSAMRKASNLDQVKVVFGKAAGVKESYPPAEWDSIVATKDELKLHFEGKLA